MAQALLQGEQGAVPREQNLREGRNAAAQGSFGATWPLLRGHTAGGDTVLLPEGTE